jgi:hypothetical protein
MTELERKIMRIIERRRLAPRPRILFQLKESLFWTWGALSLLLGGASISVLIYTLTGHATLALGSASEPFDDSFVHVVIIWLAVAAFFVTSFAVSVGRTRHGYRVPARARFSYVICAGSGLGCILHLVEAGWHIHEITEAHIPAYHHFTEAPDQSWASLSLD